MFGGSKTRFFGRYAVVFFDSITVVSKQCNFLMIFVKEMKFPLQIPYGFPWPNDTFSKNRLRRAKIDRSTNITYSVVPVQKDCCSWRFNTVCKAVTPTAKVATSKPRCQHEIASARTSTLTEIRWKERDHLYLHSDLQLCPIVMICDWRMRYICSGGHSLTHCNL